MKYLIVVDMQNDFITGTLGSKLAEEIVTNVAEKVKNFDGKVIFTRDTHFGDYMQTQEGKKLPVEHCIKGTPGWEIPECLTEDFCYSPFVVEKPTFGSYELMEHLNDFLNDCEVDTIEFVGLCTDICVVSNVLMTKAFFPEVAIVVDSKCCAGVTPESHEAALTTMKMCQIDIV